MEDEVDQKQMKKTLKEAGIEELNLSTQELVDWYKAINDSKNSAEKDQSKRVLEDQQPSDFKEDLDDVIPESPPSLTKEKPFAPKTFKSDQKPETVSNINNDKNSIDTPQDATKITFGFNDMPESKRIDHFKEITHKPKFVSVQNSVDFLQADAKKRTKILYSYHTRISKTKTELATKLLIYAVMPKPISGSEVYPEFDAEQLEETYVSRSGRQTKRKNYCYDEDSLDSLNRKKSKFTEEDSEWISKTTPSKFESKGKTLNKKTINNNNNNESSEIDLNFVGIDNVPSSLIEEKKSTIKYQPQRKVSTAEVIKRSKLFADLPARPSKSLTRSENMFDILTEQDSKKKKEEEAMEKFNKTLEQVDEDNDIDNDVDEDVISVDEPVKRRVIPTIPGRKPIHSRSKRGSTSNDITVRKTNTDDSASSQQSEAETLGRKTRYTKKHLSVNHYAIKEQPSTSQDQLEQSQNCPICNRLFPNSKIQDHASTCGDDPASLSPTPSSSKNSKIACSICDKVFPFNTEYEDHVQKCKKFHEGRI